MGKARRTITVVLPGYQRDRSAWRRAIHAIVLQVAVNAGVRYGPTDSLEVVVLLFLRKGKCLFIHDVANRLKDILDALQGRFGRSRSRRRLIENDNNNVYRVLMEKQAIPKRYGPADDPGGRMIVRPYRTIDGRRRRRKATNSRRYDDGTTVVNRIGIDHSSEAPSNSVMRIREMR